MPKEKKIKWIKATTNIATWNINGHLRDPVRREELAKDMIERNISIAGLQETRWNEKVTIIETGGT